jgi:hypothetical protein
MLPQRRRLRALLGTTETIIDLAVPVDPERDHARGPAKAPVTLVEYGDFECPYCGQAETVIRQLIGPPRRPALRPGKASSGTCTTSFLPTRSR